MFAYIDLNRELIRAGSPSSSRQDLGKHICKKKNPDAFTHQDSNIQLLPCAAGATFSAYEYLFLLDLVLGRVVDGVYRYILGYLR